MKNAMFPKTIPEYTIVAACCGRAIYSAASTYIVVEYGGVPGLFNFVSGLHLDYAIALANLVEGKKMDDVTGVDLTGYCLVVNKNGVIVDVIESGSVDLEHETIIPVSGKKFDAILE